MAQVTGGAWVVEVVIDGRAIGGWSEYSVRTSMLDPADSFTLSRPFDRDAWDLCQTDRPIRITINGVVFLTGFIDSGKISAKAGELQLAGRDKVGRLVQESAPQISFDGLRLQAVIARVASPWFEAVALSNTRNRRVVRGRGHKAAAADQVFVDVKAGTRLEPGQMRWAVIQDLADQVGALVWSAGDGSELVVGQPNYKQSPQYELRHYAPGAGKTSTVKDLTIEESTADRYSRIILLGAGAGTDANYGRPVTSRSGEVKDNPATADGEGLSFSAPKRLIIADHAVKSRQDAEGRVRREWNRRAMNAQIVSAVAEGHGQFRGGAYPTLFATDTAAYVQDEETGTQGLYHVVAVEFRCSRSSGAETTLTLLPRGTELAA